MKMPNIFIILLVIGFIGCGVTVSDYDAAIMDGVSQLNLNNPEKAIKDFERAIKIDPKRPGGYLGRANCHNTMGKYKESIADYDRALKIDAGLANAYVNRGIAYAQLGENDKAITDYEKALELDPKIDNAPGFVKRLFDNVPNKEKGIRKHLEALKKEQES